MACSRRRRSDRNDHRRSSSMQSAGAIPIARWPKSCHLSPAGARKTFHMFTPIIGWISPCNAWAPPMWICCRRSPW